MAWLDKFIRGIGEIFHDGIALPTRAGMNFIGGTVEDNPSNDTTDVTLATASAAYDTVKDESTALTQRTVLKFAGAGVSAADSGGETVVTIPGGGTTPTGTGFVHVTSGVQDAASAAVNLATADVTGTLTVAKGGTGLASAGSSGHTLTSNGSAWSTGFIANANVDPAAAIAGTKISPNFGSQNILSTGYVTIAKVELAASGPTLTRGTGAPAGSEPDGSVYLRTDGTSSTGVYTRQAGAWTALTAGSSAYATVSDEGTPLTQRTTLRFNGAGVTAADSGGETVVTIPGGGTSAASDVTFNDDNSNWADASGLAGDNVQTAVDEIVDTLGASTGAVKIGAAAVEGGTYDLSAGSVSAQLSALLTHINTVAGLGSTCKALTSDFTTTSDTPVSTGLTFAVASNASYVVRILTIVSSGASENAAFSATVPSGCTIAGRYTIFKASATVTASFTGAEVFLDSADISGLTLVVWELYVDAAATAGTFTLLVNRDLGVGTITIKAGASITSQAATLV